MDKENAAQFCVCGRLQKKQGETSPSKRARKSLLETSQPVVDAIGSEGACSTTREDRLQQ